tara:strand:- start:19 stop:468 length:450 start_codon:yes stop_codon:yes gene_type:complete
MSFAVIETGGKQYKVSANNILKVERLEIPEGKKVEFKKVLLINDNNNTEVGSPTINGAIVEGLILENLKSKKVIVFKKRRRQNSRKRYGHRQPLSKVQITKILSKGGKVISEIKLSKETKPVKKVVKNKISEVKKSTNKKVSLKVKSKK